MSTQTVTLFTFPLTTKEIEEAKDIIKQNYLAIMAKNIASELTLAIVDANAEFFHMYATQRLNMVSANATLAAALEAHIDRWYNHQIAQYGLDVMLQRSAFKVKVIGEDVFTFEYSDGVKEVLNKNTAIYTPRTAWEDKVDEGNLIRRANRVLIEAHDIPMFDKIIQG